MRFPRPLLILVSVVMIIPFGWGIGVVISDVFTRGDIGQSPALTVPLGILAAIIFAVWPSVTLLTKTKVLFFGSVFMIVLIMVACGKPATGGGLVAPLTSAATQWR